MPPFQTPPLLGRGTPSPDPLGAIHGASPCPSPWMDPSPSASLYTRRRACQSVIIIIVKKFIIIVIMK